MTIVNSGPQPHNVTAAPNQTEGVVTTGVTPAHPVAPVPQPNVVADPTVVVDPNGPVVATPVVDPAVGPVVTPVSTPVVVR
jgi:hypothetical protein